MIRSKKLRDSARGEDCTVSSGICRNETETTVLAHLPFDGGMGMKPSDLSSCYACHICHDLIDRRRNDDLGFDFEREWYMRRAQNRTLKRMVEKGLIEIK